MTTHSFPSSTLRLHTLSMLREQIINRALMDGGGVDSFIIKALRQRRHHASCNSSHTGLDSFSTGLTTECQPWSMDEVLTLATLAHTAVRSMRRLLSSMQEMADALLDGAEISDAVQHYMDKANALSTLIRSMRYNGVTLFDGSCWEKSPCLAHSPRAGKAQLQARTADGLESILLWDLSHLKKAFSPSDLEELHIAESATLLRAQQSMLEPVSRYYASLARGEKQNMS